MAEEKDDAERTEDPTQKRLDDALQRGDVAKSQEVSTWFVIAGATLILIAFSGPMMGGLRATLAGLIANAARIGADGQSLTALTGKLGLEILAAIAIPLLLLALAAVGGNVIQHRFVWSAEQLKPKLSKISPAAGVKRLFSKQALMNFVKGLAKIGLIGSVMAALLWPQRHKLEPMVTIDIGAVLPMTQALSLEMLGTVVAILALVAAADYLFQYRQWYERQKMSLREMKDEFKQTDGDPMIKGRIRRIREARMRKRMMAAVPKATVVIANPTHFAIALKYERGDNAPLCRRQGPRRRGAENPRGRARSCHPDRGKPAAGARLHATVEIDQEIPPEHYKAVAEVIGYVMRLRRAAVR